MDWPKASAKDDEDNEEAGNSFAKENKKFEWIEVFNVRLTPRKNIYISLVIGGGNGLVVFVNLRKGRYEYKAQQGFVLSRAELVHLKENLRAFHFTPTFFEKSVKLDASPRRGNYEFERFKNGEKQCALKIPLAAVSSFKQIIPSLSFFIDAVLKFESDEAVEDEDEGGSSDEKENEDLERFMVLCSVAVLRYIFSTRFPYLKPQDAKLTENDRDKFWNLFFKVVPILIIPYLKTLLIRKNFHRFSRKGFRLKRKKKC